METDLVIYGCGELGKLARAFFDSFGIDTIPVDINPESYKDDKFWAGTKIYKLEEISKEFSTLVLVCISTYPYSEIKDKLNRHGFKRVMSFFQKAEEINSASGYQHPLRNGWKIEASKEQKDASKIVKDMFIDKKSREHYSRFFAWHSTYSDKSKIQDVDCTDRYLIPEVVSALHNNEILVDAGAYDGRVSERFIDAVSGKFGFIHCFEPDEQSRRLIKKHMKQNDNIKIHNVALGNKCGKIGFRFGHGYVSNVDKNSKEKTRIVSLDSTGIKPTVIKYHLEGHELEAIRGSISTIKKCRPIVIATTYHTQQGLHAIPMYLRKNLKDYVFLWRNHNFMGQGAVMYCIPSERYRE